MSVCNTLEIKLFNGIVSDFSGRDMKRIRVVVFVVNRLHGLDVLPEDCSCTFNLCSGLGKVLLQLFLSLII